MTRQQVNARGMMACGAAETDEQFSIVVTLERVEEGFAICWSCTGVLSNEMVAGFLDKTAAIVRLSSTTPEA